MYYDSTIKKKKKKQGKRKKIDDTNWYKLKWNQMVYTYLSWTYIPSERIKT